MTTMKDPRPVRSLIALCCALGAAACAPGDGSNQSSVRASLDAAYLANLPFCGVLAAGDGALTARPLVGARDLFLVERNGAPLCVDDGDGLVRIGATLTIDPGSSNPMPGRGADSSLTPVDPGNSNPMPGSPAASNPMPGQTNNSH
jgi:hypothetical protein